MKKTFKCTKSFIFGCTHSYKMPPNNIKTITDVKKISLTGMIYTLIGAIQELEDRVFQLESL